MNNYLELVKDWHLKFGHPVNNSPVIPNEKLCKLRIDLLQEELNELKEGIENEDIVEIADALADLQYVLSGAILCFGLGNKFDEIFDEVQSSNMSKLGADGKPIYREDGKILKGPNFFRPDIKGILDLNTF